MNLNQIRKDAIRIAKIFKHQGDKAGKRVYNNCVAIREYQMGSQIVLEDTVKSVLANPNEALAYRVMRKPTPNSPTEVFAVKHRLSDAETIVETQIVENAVYDCYLVKETICGLQVMV